MWKPLVALHKRYVDESGDVLIYGFFAGLGLICSMTTMFEIVEKAIVDGSSISWSAIRLMGPQVWFPLDRDEDYMLAAIFFVYAMMYFRACMWLARAVWRRDKHLSVSWRICESGVIIYELVVGVLLRRHYTATDFALLGCDAGFGLVAVLYTLVAEKNWSPLRTERLGPEPLPGPSRAAAGPDVDAGREDVGSPGSGSSSPASGRSSEPDVVELEGSPLNLRRDVVKVAYKSRPVATSVQHPESGNIISEAPIHGDGGGRERLQESPSPVETLVSARRDGRGGGDVQPAEEGALSDSGSPSRSEGDSDCTPTFSPSRKGKYSKGTRVKSSKRNLSKSLPEITEELSHGELEAVWCDSESSPEKEMSKL